MSAVSSGGGPCNSSGPTAPSSGSSPAEWREYWRVQSQIDGADWISLLDAADAALSRLRILHGAAVLMTACPTCDRDPCPSPSFCKACRDADRRKDEALALAGKARSGNGATAQDNAASDSNRVAVLVRADKLNPESISWAWKDRFAFGKLAVLAGDPGLGKSTVLVDIVARHSVGEVFPCGEGRAQPCESLILTAEDGLRDTLIPRLIAAGADLTKIHFLTGTKVESTGDEGLFDLARDMAVLRAVLTENPNIRILIIDPLTAYLGATKAKENSEVRRVLAPLVKLIEETGVLAIGNNHLNKGAGKALYRVLDSIAFVAVGRTLHLVIKDADNHENRKFICDKTNIGSKPLGLTYIVQKTWIKAPQTGEEIETCLERGLLLLPDSKTGNKAIVLNAPALDILANLPHVGAYVIAGQAAGTDDVKPRSDLNRPWRAIVKQAGLTGLRIHDLRHTHASVGAGLGLGLPIIGKLLGHTQPSTTARYAHF